MTHSDRFKLSKEDKKVPKCVNQLIYISSLTIKVELQMLGVIHKPDTILETTDRVLSMPQPDPFPKADAPNHAVHYDACDEKSLLKYISAP